MNETSVTILNACQRPVGPSAKYGSKPVQLAILSAQAAGVDDPYRPSSPGRSFTLTERYFLQSRAASGITGLTVARTMDWCPLPYTLAPSKTSLGGRPQETMVCPTPRGDSEPV